LYIVYLILKEIKILKETAIKKINSFGKIGCIITNIAKVFLVLSMALLIGFGIFCVVFPEDFLNITFDTKANITVDMEAIGQTIDDIDEEKFKSVTFSANGKEYGDGEITVDGNKFMVDAKADDLSFSFRKGGLIMFGTAIEVAVIFVVFIFVGRLCKALRKCETPFEENVINKIKAVGYSLIPMVVLSSIEESIMGSILSGGLTIYFNIEFQYIIIMAIVFALAYIFNYGAMLQQESDETL